MIRIAIAGDYCTRYRLSSLIQNKDYDKVLSSAKAIFAEYDLSVVNLEAPIVMSKSRPIKKDGPCLMVTENAIAALQYAGVSLVTLANNHLCDYGANGVLDTIKVCEQYGVEFVGAGKNKEQAAAIKYILLKDKKVAFVNCCEHEFSIATMGRPGANHMSVIPIHYSIKEACQNADYVIVITHGGHEHYQLPSPRMKELYRFFVDSGADAVINHHQHCVSGYEIYKGKPIAYGIGNFCFDRPNTVNDKWNDGMLACLELDETNIALTLKPFVQCANQPIVEFGLDIDKRILSQVERLSEIIADDERLAQEFQQFVASKDRAYTLPFEPYGNRILSALYRRRLLPSFLSQEKNIKNYGMIHCESHLDIIKYWLTRRLNKE